MKNWQLAIQRAVRIRDPGRTGRTGCPAPHFHLRRLHHRNDFAGEDVRLGFKPPKPQGAGPY
jgi:hypothetical protein